MKMLVKEWLPPTLCLIWGSFCCALAGPVDPGLFELPGGPRQPGHPWPRALLEDSLWPAAWSDDSGLEGPEEDPDGVTSAESEWMSVARRSGAVQPQGAQQRYSASQGEYYRQQSAV